MITRYIIAFAILILSAGNGIAENAEQLVKQGDLHREHFENLDAAMDYEKAFEIKSSSFEILKKVIISYNDSGEDYRDLDRTRAEEYFNKAIHYAEISRKKFPEKDENYFLQALVYGNLARFSDGKRKVELARNVEENIKIMIQKRPDFAPSYVVLGVYYREVSELSWLTEQFADKLMGGLPDGSLEESREALEKAVSLDPDVIYAQYELAKTYESLKQYKKAIEHYRKVIDLPVTDHLDVLKKQKSERAVLRVESKLKDRVAGSF